MNRKKALLAAGLLAGAAALTGCTANTMPAATQTPQTAQQETAAPEAGESPAQTASAGGEETPGPIGLRVDGEALKADAVREGDMLLLPLVETAQALYRKFSTGKTGVPSVDETEEMTTSDWLTALLFLCLFLGWPTWELLKLLLIALGLMKKPKEKPRRRRRRDNDDWMPPFIFGGGGGFGGGSGPIGGSFGGGSFGGGGASGGW